MTDCPQLVIEACDGVAEEVRSGMVAGAPAQLAQDGLEAISAMFEANVLELGRQRRSILGCSRHGASVRPRATVP
jgi:hypothetical protein